MEKFIDDTLEKIFEVNLFGGQTPILLIINILFSVLLIAVGLILKRNPNKNFWGNLLIIIGLLIVVFNIIRLVF